MTGLLERVAGAPITWGVCEVPGWGHQLGPERVLSEMRAIGLRATELGPEGFLPADPATARASLERAGLRLVGGFVPAVLHVRDRHATELASVRRQAELLAAAGGSVLVLAAATGRDGYEGTEALDEAGWGALVEGLDRASEAADRLGVLATLHPHHGTMIAGRREVDGLLERSSVPLCLDTGHLAVGGVDPEELARQAPDRIRHVHLKDVALGRARDVLGGTTGYQDAVADGMYRPLGRGDLDVAAIVSTLEDAGYDGWYVLEQDTVLAGEPPADGGPRADARTSYEFLRSLAMGADGGRDRNRERDAGARAGKEGA